MNDEERREGPVEVAPVMRDPEFLRRAMKRSTASIDGKPRKLPHRSVSFMVDHTICTPEVFEDDFELTLRSLDSAMELEAARECRGDAATMAMLMARKSLHAVNGFPISRAEAEDEWLWNALGSAGRNLVMSMFASVATPGEAAMGKAVATVKIH